MPKALTTKTLDLAKGFRWGFGGGLWGCVLRGFRVWGWERLLRGVGGFLEAIRPWGRFGNGVLAFEFLLHFNLVSLST